MWVIGKPSRMAWWSFSVWAVTVVCWAGVGVGVWAAILEPRLPLDLEHRAVLDQDGDYVMLWTPREKDIIIEVQVVTKGYIGLGFSPNGGMKGADIVIGWVTDHGRVFLYDCHGEGNWLPAVDDSHDVKVLSGYQNDTHTVLRFTRSWNTCDQHDFHLTGDTTRVIWAYGSHDPDNINSVRMHLHQHRGTKSIYLREPRYSHSELSPDVSTWDLHASNVTLPDDTSTLYWCKLFKVPPLRRKTHLIGYEPVIEPRNLPYLHHMLLYECRLPEGDRVFDKWLGVRGVQCYTPNMPVSWIHCTSPLITWAIGSEGEMWPEHVGFPLGHGHGGADYFLLEIHYDNPTFKKGIVDESGLRLFHTERLRKYDAGVLLVGHRVTSNHIIPPGRRWKSIGHCSSQCTQQGLPEGGVKVFQALLHEHLLGRDILLRHIRNGRELPVTFKDMNYDFNYQQSRVLEQELTILPGDTLIAECGYDSTGITTPTFGGARTSDEMCLVYLSYYPQIQLDHCQSQPTLGTILNSLGLKKVIDNSDKKINFYHTKEIDEEQETRMVHDLLKGNLELPNISYDFHLNLKSVIVQQLDALRNTSLYDILYSNATWQDEQLVTSFQDQVSYDIHKIFCHYMGKPIVDGEELCSYPDFVGIKQLGSECGHTGMSHPEKSDRHHFDVDREAYHKVDSETTSTQNQPSPKVTSSTTPETSSKKRVTSTASGASVGPLAGANRPFQQGGGAGVAFLCVCLLLTCLLHTLQ
nr:DBH-like monooxygenase protein 1 [Cherax quadricarinatus]